MSTEQFEDAVPAFMSEMCPGCAVENPIRADPFCLQCLPADPLELVTERETILGAFDAALEYLLGPGPSATRST